MCLLSCGFQWSWCSFVQVMGNVYKPFHYSYARGELFFAYHHSLFVFSACENRIACMMFMNQAVCLVQRIPSLTILEMELCVV